MSKSHIVAVYGTLRQGHGNHRVIESDTTEFKGAFRTSSRQWRMVSLVGFPACCRGDGDISVEVYEVDDTTLAALDRLEGYPTLYQKSNLATPWGEATIYTMAPDAVRGAPFIPSGDWNLFTGRGEVSVLDAYADADAASVGL